MRICRQSVLARGGKQWPGVAAMESECETWLMEQKNRAIGIGSHYQAPIDKDRADWEDSVHAVVNCKVCKSVKQ
jgi:hypothetical protein